ncbi:Endonuclease/exonuclease/phosphatase [Trinorchestia longiramus]|nr:Endonuclease/exonuclease/phosphatase [Trinorchestia longiramus]
MLEIQAIASTLSHAVIAVNETWLDLSGRHLPAEVSLIGYVLHNVNKPSHNKRDGGSLIYIKEKLPSQIKAKRAAAKIGNITSYIDNILSSHETLIMGDFNLSHINWTIRQSQASGSKLIDLINTNSLQQHVNELTRRNNIPDLVMTTPELSINRLDVTDKIGDHQMIDFTLDVHDPNTRTRHKEVFDYKRANFELMKEELGSNNYEVLMSNKNAQECYMILKEKNKLPQSTITQRSE